MFNAVTGGFNRNDSQRENVRERNDVNERVEVQARKKIKHENILVSLPRDEAFFGGVIARNQYTKRIIEEMGEKKIAELGLEMEEEVDDLPGVELKRSHYAAITEVSDNKCPLIGSQLYELYQILESSNQTRKEAGKTLLSLAHEIINQIPSKDVQPMDIDDVDEEVLTIANLFRDRVPFGVSENFIENFAVNLQRAQQGNPEEAKSRDVAKVKVKKQMGQLLLSAQHDLKATAEAVREGAFEEKLDRLADCVGDLFDRSFDRVNEHAQEHYATALQSRDEALFHKFSVELADLLLLDTGSVNFGMIHDAAECLIPEEFKEYAAVDKLYFVIDSLESNPMVWKTIAHTKVPNSPDSPSVQAIRACLELTQDEPITQRHAQLTLLSALFGHFRQARAGTCFTTGPLLKMLYHNLDYFVSDLSQAIEKGSITRNLYRQRKEFPFQATSSVDFLDVKVTVNEQGKILATEKYDYRQGEANRWEGPVEDAYLWEAPGMIAVCRAMKIDDAEGAILKALNTIGQVFSVQQLIAELGSVAFTAQNGMHKLRNTERLTEEQLIQRGEYAFAGQTNHPLHRAYEQSVTTMVNYIGAQYIIPSWTFLTMEEVLKGDKVGFSREFQVKYKQLLKTMMLPMISRMRFQYNHNIQDDVKLFEEGHYGSDAASVYGYELCDTGLPADFKYSTELYEQYKQGTSFTSLERFEEYAPGHKWKKVNTAEKFAAFVKDVIQATTQHLIQSDWKNREMWTTVAEKMCLDVSRKGFTEGMVHKFFGRQSDQKKELRKNPITLQSAPWKLKWGGDFNEVLKTYYGFMEEPNKLDCFKGNQREVLAHNIDWVRKQPKEFKADFDDPAKMFIVSSPCHVFLMTPAEPSFKQACESELSAADYVKQHVEAPGLAIANQSISFEMGRNLVEYVASNAWSLRKQERHDFERQELTDVSKEKFDQLVAQEKTLSGLPRDAFMRKVWEIVVEARKSEPKIGKRNSTWEQKCKRILANKLKTLNVRDPRWKRQVLSFARNREDKTRLTDGSIKKFRNTMNQVAQGISITEFRNHIVKTCYRLHCEELCMHQDGRWKEPFCEFLDTRIFEILPEEIQTSLIDSGVVTHDPNWKDEMFDYKVIWMINPGSGKLEFCNYRPDLEAVSFRGQEHWFPWSSVKQYAGAWQLPKPYHAWKGGPLYNVNKMMDL